MFTLKFLVKMRSYNLELSLWPSFVYALFERRNGVFEKVIGYCKGCRMWVDGGRVVGTCDHEVISLWSGAWFNPSNRVTVVSQEYRELAEGFVKIYENVGLSISPYDKDFLFIPIFLSRSTDWNRNVLRWCRALWREIEEFDDLLGFDFSSMGRSFQLRQLPEALKHFTKVSLTEKDPYEIRKQLLSCKWVGPKVADAYLLFTGIDISASPVDIHMINMARRFRIPFSKIPSKGVCAKYTCEDCSWNSECLRNIFTSNFKELSGWLQTMFYVHDKLYCSRERCRECILNTLCRRIPSRRRKI